MEVIALALVLGMGNEINKAHDNIEMLNEQISIIRNEEIVELKQRIEIMNELDEKRTEDYIKQQEAINDLLVEVEQLYTRLEGIEEKHDDDFIKLGSQQASQYARHETQVQMFENLYEQQKLDMEIMKLRTDSLMEQMAIVREGIGSD